MCVTSKIARASASLICPSLATGTASTKLINSGSGRRRCVTALAAMAAMGSVTAAVALAAVVSAVSVPLLVLLLPFLQPPLVIPLPSGLRSRRGRSCRVALCSTACLGAPACTCRRGARRICLRSRLRRRLCSEARLGPGTGHRPSPCCVHPANPLRLAGLPSVHSAGCALNAAFIRVQAARTFNPSKSG